MYKNIYETILVRQTRNKDTVVNSEKSRSTVFIKYCMKDNYWIKGKKKIQQQQKQTLAIETNLVTTLHHLFPNV